ncbi:MAG: hypothetical protein OXI19_03195 [Gemmatimonadota bacterium]|nr:hypothetical protein [Gemmatimonadota bacterium]MXW04327.1 hypothetical protein [Gemmatimonadota bacterium]MYB60317.1 hypothetical protein [Gemmatimonadota bacterium]
MMINARKLILGTAAYTVCTFSLAVGWHVLLFQERYESFGYFEGEPDFLLGLLTIVLQGVLLSALFPMLKPVGTSFRRGIKFAFIAGAFFWTSHVLAFVARQKVPEVSAFIWMETAYLLVQFGLFGLILGVIYRGETQTDGRSNPGNEGGDA